MEAQLNMTPDNAGWPEQLLIDNINELVIGIQLSGVLDTKDWTQALLDLFVDQNKSILKKLDKEIFFLRNPYKLSDGEVVKTFEAPAHAYDIAITDVRELIQKYIGGEL